MCKQILDLYPQCKHSIKVSSPVPCENAKANAAEGSQHCEIQRGVCEGICPNCQNAAEMAAERAQKASQAAGSSSAAGPSSAGPTILPTPAIPLPPPTQGQVIEVEEDSPPSSPDLPTPEPPNAAPRTWRHERTVEIAPGDTQAFDRARREMDSLAARLRRQDAIAHAETEVSMRSQGVTTPQEAEELEEAMERSAVEGPLADEAETGTMNDDQLRHALAETRWKAEQEIARRDAEQLRHAFEASSKRQEEESARQQAAHQEHEQAYLTSLRKATELSLAEPVVDLARQEAEELAKTLALSQQEHERTQHQASLAEQRDQEELATLLELSHREHVELEQRRGRRDEVELDRILEMSLQTQEGDAERRAARLTTASAGFYGYRFRFDGCGHEIDGGKTRVPRDADADDLPFFLEECRGCCPDCGGEGSGAGGGGVGGREDESDWYHPHPEAARETVGEGNAEQDGRLHLMSGGVVDDTSRDVHRRDAEEDGNDVPPDYEP